MRSDYRRGRLRREDLKPDPILQFNLWLKEACDADRLHDRFEYTLQPEGSWTIDRLAPEGSENNHGTGVHSEGARFQRARLSGSGSTVPVNRSRQRRVPTIPGQAGAIPGQRMTGSFR